jgi:hypothetical protein
MQQAVDFSKNLPAPLQSIEKYQLFIMMPFLAIMLSLQLWVVYATSQNIQNGSQTTNDNMEQLSLEIWIAIQSYVSTVSQIVLAFLLTQTRVMAAIVNSQIALLEGRVNNQLRKAVGEVFETIFQKGFGAVKEQFLILVRKIDKIDGPVNDIKAKFPVENINLPTSISDNIPKMGGSFFGQFGNKR